jgi:hypothetical protein
MLFLFSLSMRLLSPFYTFSSLQSQTLRIFVLFLMQMCRGGFTSLGFTVHPARCGKKTFPACFSIA